MISLYMTLDRKTARPNSETFQLVLMGYANLKGYRWEKREGGESSFGYLSKAFTNTWGDEYMDKLRSEDDDRHDFKIDELSYARCFYSQNYKSHDEEIPDTSNADQQQSTFLLPISQRGSYGERAEHLVKHMQYLSKQPDGEKYNIEPNAQTFSYLIWALSKQQPDTRRGQPKFNTENKDMNNNKYATRASEWLPH